MEKWDGEGSWLRAWLGTSALLALCCSFQSSGTRAGVGGCSRSGVSSPGLSFLSAFPALAQRAVILLLGMPAPRHGLCMEPGCVSTPPFTSQSHPSAHPWLPGSGRGGSRGCACGDGGFGVETLSGDTEQRILGSLVALAALCQDGVVFFFFRWVWVPDLLSLLG